MIDAALIGISGFANQHLADLIADQEAGRSRLRAVTAIDQAERPEVCARLRALGCELFDDHRAMLDAWRGRLDLCFIPAPLHLHARMTIAALESGANVFVEKPAAVTVQDVDAMADAARRAGRFVAVGFQNVYAPEVRDAKRLLCGGELGPVEHVVVQGLWPRPRAYFERNGWAGRLRVGEDWVLDSPIANAMSHHLNLALFLAGADERSSAEPVAIEAELYRAADIESADSTFLRIETAGGVPVVAALTHAGDVQRDPEVVATCRDGAVRWGMASTAIARGDREERRPSTSNKDLRGHILDGLHRRLADPGAFLCDLAIGRAHVLCVDGAFAAAPVRRIDPAAIEPRPLKESTVAAVRDMPEVVAEVARTRRLPAELGVSWARPAGRLDLRGFERFAGPAGS